MKKLLTTKKGKRYAIAAVTALLIAVLLGAPVISAKYADASGLGVNVGLIDNPLIDVDNLFIYMMNKSLPAGSIYITQNPDLSTVPQMNAHFGGTWEVWGTGRAPAGVNTDYPGGNDGNGPVLTDSTIDAKGGTMNVPGKSAPISPLNLSLSGTGLSLTPGNVTATPGNVGWNGNAVVSVSGSGDLTSDPITAIVLNHTHTYTIPFTNRTWTFAGSATANVMNQANGTTYSGTTNPNGTGTTFTISTPFDITRWMPSVSLPTPSYTAPTAKYTTQYFAQTGTHSLGIANFTPTGGSGTVTWTDQTIQPYMTVYMYRRVTIANIAPLA